MSLIKVSVFNVVVANCNTKIYLFMFFPFFLFQFFPLFLLPEFFPRRQLLVLAILLFDPLFRFLLQTWSITTIHGKLEKLKPYNWYLATLSRVLHHKSEGGLYSNSNVAPHFIDPGGMEGWVNLGLVDWTRTIWLSLVILRTKCSNNFIESMSPQYWPHNGFCGFCTLQDHCCSRTWREA